jgi:hypothetical protein
MGKEINESPSALKCHRDNLCLRWSAEKTDSHSASFKQLPAVGHFIYVAMYSTVGLLRF